MRFIKMHGLGNDYIYVDCFREKAPRDPAAAAAALSRRHFSVGGDGLVLIEPSARADARMRIFNADGSEAEMCGNALRCVGKYLYDSGLRRKGALTVDTLSGIKRLEMIIESGVAVGARADMGAPRVTRDGLTARAAGREFTLTEVDMGNPHAVCFDRALPDDGLFFEAGPALEKCALFPARCNIEFCAPRGESELDVRVWERGSGATLACGTGACATLVAAAHRGLCGKSARVNLPGGALEISWESDGHVYMRGPARLAYTGEVTLD